MHISEKGLNIIKNFEGCRLKSYKCPAGKWTIGYGHTNGVKEGQVITQQEANNLLKQDLIIYENHVNSIVKLSLNQNQFDALVSFTYNCGAGYLKTLVSNRNYKQISEAILLYNKGGGKVLQGLVKRRKAEQQLFLEKLSTQEFSVIITASFLNVRQGIGTKYKIMKVLKKGDKIQVTKTSNGWGLTPYGWISLNYTKKI